MTWAREGGETAPQYKAQYESRRGCTRKKEGGVSGQRRSTEFSTVDRMCGGMGAMMGISGVWDAC